MATSSTGIVAKFSTIADGVWIEQAETPLGTTRAWRFDEQGRAEWACLDALKAGSARWFGHQFTAKDFILA
jgi:hypothetical protein